MTTPRHEDERRERIAARLRRCSAMLRADNPQLWTNVSEKGLAHRRVCEDPDHIGCMKLQAVEAMGEAADLLAAASPHVCTCPPPSFAYEEHESTCPKVRQEPPSRADKE